MGDAARATRVAVIVRHRRHATISWGGGLSGHRGPRCDCGWGWWCCCQQLCDRGSRTILSLLVVVVVVLVVVELLLVECTRVWGVPTRGKLKVPGVVGV